MEQNIPQNVIDEVEKELDVLFAEYPKGTGFCHIYWNKKKEFLAQRGYFWKSPADLNPNTCYD